MARTRSLRHTQRGPLAPARPPPIAPRSAPPGPALTGTKPRPALGRPRRARRGCGARRGTAANRASAAAPWPRRAPRGTAATAHAHRAAQRLASDPRLPSAGLKPFPLVLTSCEWSLPFSLRARYRPRKPSLPPHPRCLRGWSRQRSELQSGVLKERGHRPGAPTPRAAARQDQRLLSAPSHQLQPRRCCGASAPPCRPAPPR